MEKIDWTAKVAGLKHLLKKVGRLWTGTELSGYAEKGPYSCGNCRYMFVSPKLNVLHGTALCGHLAVKADPETKKDEDGFPIVNAVRGCCEFVETPK